MRIVKWSGLLGLALMAGGCMQVDYGIVLEDDLSGTTDLDMTIDLDRIAYSAAMIQAAFEGTGEPPTEEGDALDFKDESGGCSLNPSPAPALPWLLLALVVLPLRRRRAR